MNYALAALTRWNAFSKTTQLVIGAALFAAVALTIVCGIVARPARVTLFATPLHPEQLAEVQERLASWNVAFTPTADNVVIDAGRRSDVLLRLSLAGVPHAHLETTGEALANVGVLTPQAVIDAQARAGLAGDLEAGLRGIDGVDDARVIVAPAKLAEFADESARDASASVRLLLRAGTHLPHATVEGIRRFVAAGVSGLDPSRVTILDDRGVALGDGDDGEDAADLQNSLQSALDSAFGDASTIVRVRVEHRNERLAQREVRRSALTSPPVATVLDSESYGGAGKHYHHDVRNDDRGSDTRESVRELQPDAIARVSAAVFVDRAHLLDLPKVRDLAAATIGYDPKRGDTLAVAAVDFHRTPVPRKDVWWLLYGTIVPLAPAAVIALALLAVGRMAVPPSFALLREWLERAAVQRASRAVAGLAPSRVRGALVNEPPHAAAAIISALPAATAAAVLNLYPPHEREAIVARMQRAASPLLGDAQEFLRDRVH
ncbi:MAG TPA: flagellar M-ring protein FliF C-terminal domain-containing protein [Candidatus Baltobacteraceae bacterium]|nr:flagellar M-ring protein FliF C-terminal domain-containing protein [Candidatus Baltobacteraceae bacterium]